METFGVRVRRLRETRGITARDLSARTGIAYSTLKDIENGRQHSTTKLPHLLRELRTNARYLETGKGDPDALEGTSHSLPTSLSTEASTAHSGSEIRPGYVRLGLLDAAGDMGDGAENVDFPEVIREMDLAEVQLRNLIGFLPRPGRLKLMTGRGISMEPVIRSGDVVIVDTGCQRFDGDGIYVINTGNGVQIKALQDRGDGIYVVSANPTFPAYKAGEGLIIGGKVHVRNRLERLD